MRCAPPSPRCWAARRSPCPTRAQPTQLREVLEGNVEELERLSDLISDMLFIARADHNVNPIQAEPVDLRQEAQRVADYLSLVADERKLTLSVIGAARPAQADRLLVQRAITNLLSNAIRHANEGSTITIELGGSADETTLAVVNEGQVIDADNLPRIFERFYRVDQSRSRGAGGTGLGLAIVRSIAALHQGHVSVASDSGRTTFTLSLPCARDRATPARPAAGERASAKPIFSKTDP